MKIKPTHKTRTTLHNKIFRVIEANYLLIETHQLLPLAEHGISLIFPKLFRYFLFEKLPGIASLAVNKVFRKSFK